MINGFKNLLDNNHPFVLAYCYAMLGLGFTLYLITDNSASIVLCSLPGCMAFVYYLYAYLDKQIKWIIELMEDRENEI